MSGSRVSPPSGACASAARRRNGQGRWDGQRTAVKAIRSHDDERGSAFMRGLICVVSWSTRTGLRNGTIARMEVGRVSGGRTEYSNTHAASALAACAAPACRPSRVCASAAWDDTRAMAIPVHVGGRARAKASAALLRVGPRWPSCSSPIVEVGEECAVEARGAGWQRGGMRQRQVSYDIGVEMRTGTRRQQDEEGVTTQRRCDNTGYSTARAIRAVWLSTGFRP
ncbi:hypothetical protein B0H13DRAFT_2130886 [Mycena leptocephala]|nr:hypothetical protein B0H13DRAFT_2130886 [Mycena leptocephala]